MGTDIHGVFQRLDGATWHDVPSEYEFNRHYQLFAALAGVRNGFGFAGVQTGEAVKPIAEPRGLPGDFTCDDMGDHPISSRKCIPEWKRSLLERGDRLAIWMGDHSHSWLTADEMLAWAAQAPTVVKTGVLAKEDYLDWDGVSRPPRYSGDVRGGGVVVINDSEVEKAATPTWAYIRCTWTSSLSEELAYFFDEVRRLTLEHGQVRFVFGFDS